MTTIARIAALAAGALALSSGALAQGVPAYKVTGHIPLPDGGWDYATFDVAGRQVYLAKGATIVGLDLDSGKVNPKAAAAAGSHTAVPLPDRRLLITNGGTTTVTIVNAVDGSVLASLPTGAQPDAAIYDPSSGLAFVADHSGGDVMFIDPKTQTVAGQVMVGGTLEFLAADGKGHLFVNVENKNEIAKIDIKTKTVLANYAVTGCDSPGGLAYDVAAGALIAACHNKAAAVIDPVTGKTLKTLPMGDGPDAVLYDPRHRLAFVPCGGGEGTLAVIGGASPDKLAVVQTVPTQTGARSGAVDPKTGKLYLTNAKFSPPAPGERRGSLIPGSVEFLVVSP